MNITLDLLQKLCTELCKEEKIMKSRITPEKICDLHKRRLCLFLFDKAKTKIIGFGALWPTRRENWFELGSMWLDKDFRQKGDGWKVFEKTAKLAPKKSTLFLITLSESVRHMAKYHCWEQAPGWQNSTQWKYVCEPWDKLPHESTRRLPKGGWLFYRIALD